MTDTPKPLTADEIAEWKAHGGNTFYLGAEFAQRVWATIEQQAEQIEKLREALIEQRACFSGDTRATILRILSDAEYDQWVSVDKRSDEALAATEPTR